MRLKVGISSCLMGDEVRFDGGHKRSAFATDELTRHIDLVRFCPEVGIGMPVPRPTIRLEKHGNDGSETVEAVMGYFAKEMGYGEEEEFWSLVGLLHDIDFEEFPEEHCIKAPELLAEISASPEFVHAVVSHGYGLCTQVAPEHLMEKILFATDELTGLIGAAALMRPSKSVCDMELSSLKKKYKDKKFAAGCSREVIATGAEMLGWELDELLEKTLTAMKATCS